ncbi:AAA family ATPase [Micromonospora sp. URMC 103]|uniref:AAA family ATPase n=1 Tax=Micromonospora sp. URMC 103 TaxID=3423406 RepID=UPI003F19F796
MCTVVAAAPRVPPRWPVPQERRTVTVLFVDIVGSTALVNRLDPEDVRALQLAYFDTVAAVLRRWQGAVEKYIGDAVMALFGARASDGFDAYRAVRAGLEIQRELDGRPLPGGVAIRVRVGVATGEAVVDLAAARDGLHGAASGAVMTTAARLQEHAPPGGVVCCAATHRATAGLVAQRRLTPVTVPHRAPVTGVWQALGPGLPPAGRHDGPLVGRRRELATVRDRITQAVRERRPRWVSVVGASGSGRSRLLHELAGAVATVDGTPVRWCVAACPPYPDQPLAPVARLLRVAVGLGADEPASVARTRLAAVLVGLLAPSRLAAALPALDRLLTAPDATPAAAEGAGWCQEVLLRLAAGRPLVVAIDDLDRAAPAVDRFLHALFTTAAARELPLAVVALHRPDRAGALPPPTGPAGSTDASSRVPLRPLTPMQTGRLLRHLLIRADRPVSLVASLLPLVGGTPGHAAAYVHELAEGGGCAAPPLPEALRRAVGAELDRLDGTGRAVLMAAAVLPAGFTAEEVERVLGWSPGRVRPALTTAAAAGLLIPHPPGGHALASPALRRVATDRLPRRLRAGYARRAVDVVMCHRLRRTDPAGTSAAPGPHRPAAAWQAPPVHPAGTVAVPVATPQVAPPATASSGAEPPAAATRVLPSAPSTRPVPLSRLRPVRALGAGGSPGPIPVVPAGVGIAVPSASGSGRGEAAPPSRVERSAA